MKAATTVEQQAIAIGELPSGVAMQRSPAGTAARGEDISRRKQAVRDLADAVAEYRDTHIARAKEFHQQDCSYLRFLIPENSTVLEIGCGTGHLLAALKPSRGFGVDLSSRMIAIASAKHPELEFVVADAESPQLAELVHGEFDFIVLHDTMGMLEDCQATLTNLRRFCHTDTRLVVAYHNYLWEPLLGLAATLGLRSPAPLTNWLKPRDIANLLDLADFEVVRTDWRQLVPLRLFGIGRLINRFVATLPAIRRLCVHNYLVARPLGLEANERPSVTVIVPCRNECGNIEQIVRRIPQFCEQLEIIFVEGHSRDGTYEEIERVMRLFPSRNIRLMRQDGKGKGDAVYKGFDAARGEVLIILDADLSVPPARKRYASAIMRRLRQTGPILVISIHSGILI